MVECIKYIVAFGIAALSIYNKVYRRMSLGAKNLMGTGIQFSLGGEKNAPVFLVFDYAVRRVGSSWVLANFSGSVLDLLVKRRHIPQMKEAVRREFDLVYRDTSSMTIGGGYVLDLVNARLVDSGKAWYLFETTVRLGNEYKRASELFTGNILARIRLLDNPRRTLESEIDKVRVADERLGLLN